MQKALEEDSTVYDYDAVYEDIQKQRNETNKKILGGTDKRVISFTLRLQRDAVVRKTVHEGFALASMQSAMLLLTSTGKGNKKQVQLHFRLCLSSLYNSQSISTS